MEALRDAILRALQEGDLLPDDAMSDELRKMLQDPGALNSRDVRDLIDKLVERLSQEGFINPQQPPQVTPPPQTSARGQLGSRRIARPRRASRSPTRRSTSSASRRCRICWARWAAAASAATIRATSLPVSKRAASRANTSLATR